MKLLPLLLSLILPLASPTLAAAGCLDKLKTDFDAAWLARQRTKQALCRLDCRLITSQPATCPAAEPGTDGGDIRGQLHRRIAFYVRQQEQEPLLKGADFSGVITHADDLRLAAQCRAAQLLKWQATDLMGNFQGIWERANSLAREHLVRSDTAIRADATKPAGQRQCRHGQETINKLGHYVEQTQAMPDSIQAGTACLLEQAVALAAGSPSCKLGPMPR